LVDESANSAIGRSTPAGHPAPASHPAHAGHPTHAGQSTPAGRPEPAATGGAPESRPAGHRLELRADRDRQLTSIDPDGHMLLLSCGAALHHARVSLAAAGVEPLVERLPDPADPDLLATVRCGAPLPPDETAARLRAAMPRRRTDRRPYADEPVDDAAVRDLRTAVADAGAYLHLVRPDQLPMLAIAAAQAAAAQVNDAAYRVELARWTHRPVDSGDGVPSATAVPAGPRRVPVRDFAPDGTSALTLGDGTDRGARYLLLFGASDDPADWLRGGEALSALLLTAVDLGLSAAPMSDVVEVPWPRQALRGLLADLGEPYLVVRVGYARAEPPPATPRRAADDAINGGGDLVGADGAVTAVRDGPDSRVSGRG
jgi:hypothetical protein